MKNLFSVSVKDAQYIAQKEIGRKLKIEELEQIERGLEFGLECWEDVTKEAIREATKENS